MDNKGFESDPAVYYADNKHSQNDHLGYLTDISPKANGKDINGTNGGAIIHKGSNGTTTKPYTNGKDTQTTVVLAKEPEVEVDAADVDPWKVTSISQNYTPWNELDGTHKVLRAIGYFIKLILVLGCLYMFICSLDFLSSAFRLLGGEAAGKVFQQNDIMTNPVAGLMMGVLVTVLVQSSSTSTSIVVSMVASKLLDVRTAIPIVMGANIGTSVTNTIVALGQISDKGEFRRAFAGATVHDMFNWLTVIVLLPIEIITGYLFHLTEAIVDSLPLQTNKGAKQELLKVITAPFTKLIVEVNKDAIKSIAENTDRSYDHDKSILHVCCDKETPGEKCENYLEGSPIIEAGSPYSLEQREEVCRDMHEFVNKNTSTYTPSCVTTPWRNVTAWYKKEVLSCARLSDSQSDIMCCDEKIAALNSTSHDDVCSSISSCFTSTSNNYTTTNCLNAWTNVTNPDWDAKKVFSCFNWAKDVENKQCFKQCEHLFMGLYPALNDKEIGAILLVISLAILCLCLVCIVKLLHSLLKGPMALLIKKFVNADFPGPMRHLTGYLAILLGAGFTFVVQSSSIFTSTLTPLVGIGVIELDRMYPLTLGSNIGTTTTAILSALANSAGSIRLALQIAFCHLFFNISGILIFYPIHFMRFPIPLAKFLGNKTAEYRWYAIVYILVMFFIFPALVFALSIPGWYVLAAVMGPILLLVIFIAIIKCIQAKRKHVLPGKLQDWKFLPTPLRSLAPYDNAMQKVFFCKRFQRLGETPNDKPIPLTNGKHDPIQNGTDINTRL